MLRRIKPADVSANRRSAVDPVTLREAALIVDDVRENGEAALVKHALRLGDMKEGDPLVLDRGALKKALGKIDAADRDVLERTAERIRKFAGAQRKSLKELKAAIPGGSAGHFISPVDRAGCYAPGGRFPLPSSVLMTVITAKTAGVKEVWAASPRPSTMTIASAAVAGADALLCAGGAQAIAAFAYGAGKVPRCDMIVGPGNRWVTAAKKLVSGDVGIDMLAGPSELVVVADESADPAVITADLLAQAEHDTDAIPILVAISTGMITAVEKELQSQLEGLPTAGNARIALTNGYMVVVKNIEEAISVCDRIAPEHLELQFKGASKMARRFGNYGALFIGGGSAEVFGDYGAGPNHVLPTGGTARFSGGLSVFNFMRVRTWMKIDSGNKSRRLASDTTALARMEGLEAHARAAEKRMRKKILD